MIIFSCYTILVIMTLYVIITAVTIIKKTSSLILAVPVLIMYFWTLYGAWSFIPLKLAGGSIYYEDIMFRVHIDEYYLESLVLYSLFIVIFAEFMKSIARHKVYITNVEHKQQIANYKLYINRLNDSGSYTVIVCLFLFVFVYFSSTNLLLAISQGVSAYTLSRFNSALGSAGSLVTFAGDTFLYLSIPLLFVGKMWKRYVVIISILLYFMINALLGNRNTLLCGMIIGVLLTTEIWGIKKIFNPKAITVAVLVFAGIQAISIVRGLSVNDIISGNYSLDLFDVFGSLSNSNEKYAAHISMYGVLKNDVPFTYGSSILALISTFIPTFMGVQRADDIYHYYVLHTMQFKPDIGVTLHHAAGWYMNFGLIGVVCGALLWGYVMKWLYSKRLKFIYFYGSILFASVTIQMIRGGGLESYKGVLLMDTLIPMLIIYYCSKNRSKRLCK